MRTCLLCSNISQRYPLSLPLPSFLSFLPSSPSDHLAFLCFYPSLHPFFISILSFRPSVTPSMHPCFCHPPSLPSPPFTPSSLHPSLHASIHPSLPCFLPSLHVVLCPRRRLRARRRRRAWTRRTPTGRASPCRSSGTSSTRGTSSRPRCSCCRRSSLTTRGRTPMEPTGIWITLIFMLIPEGRWFTKALQKTKTLKHKNA